MAWFIRDRSGLDDIVGDDVPSSAIAHEFNDSVDFALGDLPNPPLGINPPRKPGQEDANWRDRAAEKDINYQFSYDAMRQ